MTVTKSIQPTSLFDRATGLALKVLQDGSDYLLGIAAKIRDSSGTLINPAQDETFQGSVDSGNSTTSQLAADAVFTGTGVDITDYSSIIVDIHSDQSSATNGIEFQGSHDDSVWHTYLSSTLNIAVDDSKYFRPPVHARYFRVKYTNGGTITTGLSIQTLLFRRSLPQSEISDNETVGNYHRGIIIAGTDDNRLVRFANIDEDRNLRVAVADDPAEPIFVTVATGGRSYYHTNLVNSDEPAEVSTGADEPYDVGGDTLTISVDGGANQTPTFATRAAQAGIHYSAPHPRTANPDHQKLKVSIDGGALVEVQIGKGWTSAAAIAAALQTQIRANVPNGTNMTVEYDTADYPYRYVFKSGTTGASSIMHVEKGGDDLAKSVLFVDTQFGGTERIGLAADNYWAYEVISFLIGELSDVQVFAEGNGVTIQTVSQGSSASLLVTSGGANTALQFPTTTANGTTGSGDDDMAVDGSTTTVRYSVSPPAGRKFAVDKIRFAIRDDGIALNKFASLDPLTNGVKLEVRSENLGLIPVFTAVTSAGLMAEADAPGEGEIIDNGWATGGQDMLKAVFSFSPGLTITDGSTTNFVVSIQDDLTDLEGEFTVRASGWIEEESE